MAGGWTTAARVGDSVVAQMIVDLLLSKGVPARIVGDTVLLGAARECRILVPDDYLRRASLFVPPEFLVGAAAESVSAEDDDPAER